MITNIKINAAFNINNLEDINLKKLYRYNYPRSDAYSIGFFTVANDFIIIHHYFPEIKEKCDQPEVWESSLVKRIFNDKEHIDYGSFHLFSGSVTIES